MKIRLTDEQIWVGIFLAGCAMALLLAVPAWAQTGKGSTVLSWEPATEYDDESPMQLAEQRLFVVRTNETVCGTAPTTFEQFQVVSAGIAAFTVENQWNGAYYYVATSVDVFGNESLPSNVACKVILISGNWQPPGVGVRPKPPRNLRAD